jgi:hypothetical protein
MLPEFKELAVKKFGQELADKLAEVYTTYWCERWGTLANRTFYNHCRFIIKDKGW